MMHLIQEAHPLKQGLKHYNGFCEVIGAGIQEAHPLKQGLKLEDATNIIFPHTYSRGASTKTRIETCSGI